MVLSSCPSGLFVQPARLLDFLIGSALKTDVFGLLRYSDLSELLSIVYQIFLSCQEVFQIFLRFFSKREPISSRAQPPRTAGGCTGGGGFAPPPGGAGECRKFRKNKKSLVHPVPVQ